MVFRKIKHITFSRGARITVGIIFSVLILLYLAFLFVVPNVIDLNSFLPQIQEELSKYTKLELELDNPKLSTTFDLGVKVSADKIALNYSKEKPFLSLDNASIKINLPTLILKHLNLDKIYIQKADVNFVFDKNKKYTLFDYFTEQKKEALIEGEETQEENNEEISELPIEIRNINLIIDEANIRLKDENVSKTFAIRAHNNQIKLSSLNGPLTFKTKGDLIIEENDKKFLDFDINLETVFPKTETKEAQNGGEAFELPNFNPLLNLDNFNFYSNIYTNLKITDLSEHFSAKGEVKIDGITALIKTIKLPESSINVSFKGDEIKSLIDLYIAKNESLKAQANIKSGKNLNMDLEAKTDKISLDNLRLLLGAALDILNIENDFKNMTSGGYLTCDFHLKGDSKKIQSSGSSELKGGYLKYSKENLNVSDIVSLLDFSNNKLTIKDTSATLNGSKFSVKGEILPDSTLNINAQSDPLKIPDLIKLALQLKLVKERDIADYNFSGGILTLLVKLSGKLDNIIPDAKIDINNLAMTIKSLQMPVKISNIMVKAKPEGKDFIADIDVNNLSASLGFPKLNITAQQGKLSANSSKIILNNTPFKIDGADSKIEGEIANYMTKPEFKFDIKGNLSPQTILNSVPKENRNLIKYQGSLPYSANVSGDFNNIKVKAEGKTNPSNYVSVIDIESTKGLENTLLIDLILSGQNLTLNDISINSKGSKVALIKGNLSSIYAKNPVIKSLQISIPKETRLNISALGNTKMNILANLNITGSVMNPSIIGNANITGLSYPDYDLTLSSLKADFKKNTIGIAAQGVNIANSDLDLTTELSSNFSKNITINSLNFSSNKIDTDKLLALTSKMPNTQTTPGPSAPSIIINKGNGTIKKATSGGLSAENIGFDFDLKNNLFTLKNLKALAYQGTITGDVTYNIAQLRANAKVDIKNLNVGQFSKAMAGVIIPVTGTLSGNANLGFKGADLNSQLKSLNGSTQFVIEKGEIKEFIKLENFLHAGNILSQNIFGFNLNSVLSAIASKNTGEFKTLDGEITFSNSWAEIKKFKTKGYNMSLNVKGKYNILTNYADLRTFGRISSSVASAMGPLANYSLGQTVDNLASQNEAISTIIKIAKTVAPTNGLLQEATNAEIAEIPALATEGVETKEFMAILQGNALKTTSVKTFKWLKKKDQASE